MKQQRPSGVTILAILFAILGLLSFGWAIIVFNVGLATGLFGGLFGAENLATVGRSGAWSGFVGGAGALLNLIIAFGLFTLKRWAWVLAFIGVALNVVQGVLGLFSGGLIALCCGLVGLAIPAVILFYLTRPDVRRAFGYTSSDDGTL
ncbi:MAG: hypothetical protein R6X18_17600 [Chloroflexota bacterium]|jgi:hypothetical protein